MATTYQTTSKPSGLLSRLIDSAKQYVLPLALLAAPFNNAEAKNRSEHRPGYERSIDREAELQAFYARQAEIYKDDPVGLARIMSRAQAHKKKYFERFDAPRALYASEQLKYNPTMKPSRKAQLTQVLNSYLSSGTQQRNGSYSPSTKDDDAKTSDRKKGASKHGGKEKAKTQTSAEKATSRRVVYHGQTKVESVTPDKPRQYTGVGLRITSPGESHSVSEQTLSDEELHRRCPDGNETLEDRMKRMEQNAEKNARDVGHRIGAIHTGGDRGDFDDDAQGLVNYLRHHDFGGMIRSNYNPSTKRVDLKWNDIDKLVWMARNFDYNSTHADGRRPRLTYGNSLQERLWDAEEFMRFAYEELQEDDDFGKALLIGGGIFLGGKLLFGGGGGGGAAGGGSGSPLSILRTPGGPGIAR